MWIMDVKDHPAMSGEIAPDRLKAIIDLNFPEVPSPDPKKTTPLVEALYPKIKLDVPSQVLKWGDYKITLTNTEPEELESEEEEETKAPDHADKEKAKGKA